MAGARGFEPPTSRPKSEVRQKAKFLSFRDLAQKRLILFGGWNFYAGCRRIACLINRFDSKRVLAHSVQSVYEIKVNSSRNRKWTQYAVYVYLIFDIVLCVSIIS